MEAAEPPQGREASPPELESEFLSWQRECEIMEADLMRSLLKLQAFTERAAGTGTVLRPMKDLLLRDYAFRHTRTARRDGKQQIVVCIVDVQRSCPGELV